jgi:hypothetical protein
MWGQHVKRRGRWWHYYRATPKAFCVVERRKVITFALRTSDVAQAKLQAAQISLDFDAAWADAVTGPPQPFKPAWAFRQNPQRKYLILSFWTALER